MTYKEFKEWCNDRAADGCWGMTTAMVCIDIIGKINRLPFWKRNRIWKEDYESDVVEGIVEPINKKIREVKENINE